MFLRTSKHSVCEQPEGLGSSLVTCILVSHVLGIPWIHSWTPNTTPLIQTALLLPLSDKMVKSYKVGDGDKVYDYSNGYDNAGVNAPEQNGHYTVLSLCSFTYLF